MPSSNAFACKAKQTGTAPAAYYDSEEGKKYKVDPKRRFFPRSRSRSPSSSRSRSRSLRKSNSRSRSRSRSRSPSKSSSRSRSPSSSSSPSPSRSPSPSPTKSSFKTGTAPAHHYDSENGKKYKVDSKRQFFPASTRSSSRSQSPKKKDACTQTSLIPDSDIEFLKKAGFGINIPLLNKLAEGLDDKLKMEKEILQLTEDVEWTKNDAENVKKETAQIVKERTELEYKAKKQIAVINKNAAIVDKKTAIIDKKTAMLNNDTITKFEKMMDLTQRLGEAQDRVNTLVNQDYTFDLDKLTKATRDVKTSYFQHALRSDATDSTLIAVLYAMDHEWKCSELLEWSISRFGQIFTLMEDPKEFDTSLFGSSLQAFLNSL